VWEIRVHAISGPGRQHILPCKACLAQRTAGQSCMSRWRHGLVEQRPKGYGPGMYPYSGSCYGIGVYDARPKTSMVTQRPSTMKASPAGVLRTVVGYCTTTKLPLPIWPESLFVSRLLPRTVRSTLCPWLLPSRVGPLCLPGPAGRQFWRWRPVRERSLRWAGKAHKGLSGSGAAKLGDILDRNDVKVRRIVNASRKS
jgi:hypothetical protein